MLLDHLDYVPGCAQLFSHVRLFVTLWTVAHQAPLSMGSSQARTLEWVAISSSRGSSQPRDGTCISCVSCIAGGFFSTESTGKSTLCLDCINLRFWQAHAEIYCLPDPRTDFMCKLPFLLKLPIPSGFLFLLSLPALYVQGPVCKPVGRYVQGLNILNISVMS